MKNLLIPPLTLVFAVAALWSCTVVKRYDAAVPFIHENEIKLKGVADKEKSKEILDRLDDQIEDSAKVYKVSRVPWPRFPWFIPVPVIERPLPYDSLAVKQSMVNMRNLMAVMGYKNSVVTSDSALKRVKDQQRIRVEYEVEAGRLFVIDTVVFNLSDTLLQRLAWEHRSESLLKKGDPFENQSIDRELNRLVDLFQNNGYHRFTREDIIVEADSSYSELIDPTLDPFEYIRKLAEEKEKRKNPQVDVYVRLNNVRDSSHIRPYRVGSVTVYSDALTDDGKDPADSAGTLLNGLRIVNRRNTFEPSFIAEQVALKPGLLYTRERYSQTLNNFNRLGAWQNINIQSQNIDSAGLIDYMLKLTPAKRQYFSVDLEGSSIINSMQAVQVGSGRVGMAVNFTLRNRNLWRRAIQLENNLRTGIEFNNFQRILSGEVTLTNRLSIPWMETPFSEAFEKRFENARTVISADFSYIDRFKYFTLRTFNTFLGYEWRKGPYTSWQFKPINFEYTQFKPDSLFLETIKDFPLLLYSYNNGLIIGTNLTYNHNFTPFSRRKSNLLRLYAEESGVLLGALFPGATAPRKPLNTLYRFIKFDADYRHFIQWDKTSLHFRLFAGAGFALPTRTRRGEVTLPFFKSYVAGGPNSMRGWQIRKMGIGSNISLDTALDGRFNDKYADIKLEANMEYRFNLFSFYGFWMRGAIFTDIGNIWYRSDLNGQLPGAEFRFKDLYRDLGVASGFGLRVDFSYFLLRFDLGFPVKDPRYGPQYAGNPKTQQFYSPRNDGWFAPDHWHKPVFQFAIGYPF